MRFPTTWILSALFALCAFAATPANAATVEYHLTIREKQVNFTGKTRTALAVNDSIPAPTLTFHEGDLARIHVTNAMKVESSTHWHGMLVPNRMDGVPFVTFPPIKPGATFDSITMGGLFTVLKVREGIASYDDPGWYQNPEGTVASLASADELRRDGIEIKAGAAPVPATGHGHH